MEDIRLLFFDTESGNGHTASMCSFGYVITDENFNIIDSNDIFMDPEKKWEKRVLNEVLFYPKEHFEKYPSFKYCYDKIKSLFTENTIIIGHAIENDIIALNGACKRYNLPYINFKYYISNEIFREFTGNKNARIGLDKISENLGIERQNEKHTSLQDAKLVMLQVQEMCKQLEMSIKDIISIVDYCNGENINGQWHNSKKPLNDGINGNLLKGNNIKKFITLINNIDIIHDKNSQYNNKLVSISYNYEVDNFKELLLIVVLLSKIGGMYSRKASISDYYITYGDAAADIKMKYVDEAIANGKNIAKIELDDFLKSIGFDKKNIEENYKECKKAKFYKKEEPKYSATTFGDLFEDKLKEYKEEVNIVD